MSDRYHLIPTPAEKPWISHKEMQIMKQRSLELLTEMAENPSEEKREAYHQWLVFVQSEINERGLECQDCRLALH